MHIIMNYSDVTVSDSDVIIKSCQGFIKPPKVARGLVTGHSTYIDSKLEVLLK